MSCITQSPRNGADKIGSAKRERGAVLLLAIYFVSLTLAAITAISLQRTTIEMRSAELSRDTHQSFFLAEASLDYALACLKKGVYSLTGEPLKDYQEYALSPLNGKTGSFKLIPISGSIKSLSEQEIVRQIEASGPASSSIP